VDSSSIRLAVIVSAPFEENTYIAHLEGHEDCLVVDPGLDPDAILTHLARAGLTPSAILITHGHSDHIAGNEVLLGEGDRYSAAGFDLLVREIPGHSSGHVVFIVQGVQPPIVFGGDVLFSGGIGRTDFPDGSFEQLAEGIWEKLFTMDDATVVLPGHGPTTTVGQEKRSNPFVGKAAGFRGPAGFKG